MGGMLDLSSGTGYGRIDAEDAIVSPFFVLATFVLSGVASVSIFGYDFAEGATEIAGHEPSIAFVVAVVALGIAWATNRPDIDGMDSEYQYLTVGGAALLVGMEFVPQVSEFVAGSDAVGVVAAAVLGGTYYAIAYLG